MTRGQRRAHRRIWVALAVMLPVGIAAGLLAGPTDEGRRAHGREASASIHDSETRRAREAVSADEHRADAAEHAPNAGGADAGTVAGDAATGAGGAP